MSGWVYNGVGFKAGDLVRVVRFEETGAPNGMGDGFVWDNAWTETMDEILKYPDMTYQIDVITEQGAEFVNEPEAPGFTEFAYPLSALEKVVY